MCIGSRGLATSLRGDSLRRLEGAKEEEKWEWDQV